MSELDKVKILLGIDGTKDDGLITLLLLEAESIINGLSRISNSYKHLKLEAVVIAYNQRGAEGNKTTGSDGFSQSWYFDTMSSFIKSKMPAQYAIK